jgi:hypothetical protein
MMRQFWEISTANFDREWTPIDANRTEQPQMNADRTAKWRLGAAVPSHLRASAVKFFASSSRQFVSIRDCSFLFVVESRQFGRAIR